MNAFFTAVAAVLFCAGVAAIALAASHRDWPGVLLGLVICLLTLDRIIEGVR